MSRAQQRYKLDIQSISELRAVSLLMSHSSFKLTMANITVSSSMILLVFIILPTIIMSADNSVKAQARMLQIQGCTSEELRRSILANCMKVGRDQGSGLSLNPYGSTDPLDLPGSGLDSVMETVVTSTISQTGRTPGRFLKRSNRSGASRLSEDYCCHESCQIEDEQLAPRCAMV